MKAVRIEQFGGAQMMQLSDIEAPMPRHGEVLICVKGASVNPIDWKTREGRLDRLPHTALPLTLGRDVAGTIHALGPGTLDASVGDEVYAQLPHEYGGFAQFTIAKASTCAQKPRRLDFIEAAAVPLAALTAWQGLFTHGRLRRGQHVLILGASGGVGHFAVQFAHAIGAHVFAVASAAAHRFVLDLGADHVLQCADAPFSELAGRIELVFDLVGGGLRDAVLPALVPDGMLVSTLEALDASVCRERKLRSMHFTTRPDRQHLTRIGRLIDTEQVRPVIAAHYALEDVVQALAHAQSGHPQGKVVLRIDPTPLPAVNADDSAR